MDETKGIIWALQSSCICFNSSIIQEGDGETVDQSCELNVSYVKKTYLEKAFSFFIKRISSFVKKAKPISSKRENFKMHRKIC